MALWRVEEAADYLGIRPKTLYEWVRLGRVPYRKLGFNVRFDAQELDAWVAEQSPGRTKKRRGRSRNDDAKSNAPVPATSAAAATAIDPEVVEQLRELAGEAAQQIRRVEADVGAELSFPQRQALRNLAKRLVSAAGTKS